MALTYDLTKIDNYEELWDNSYPQVEALIFSTIAVGIGSLTDETIVEFTARLHLWERAYGYPETPVEFIKSMRGLKTNAAFTTEPRAKWFKRVMPGSLDNIIRRTERELAGE